MNKASVVIADGVDGVALAYARGRAGAVYAAVDAFARTGLDHRLCTINRFDAAGMRVVRLYSSNEQAYPPGGSKSKAGMPWGQQVLLDKRVFVGEGDDAIAQAFDDHAAIAALGLRSVINVPVVVAEQCLGTVNFLMTRAEVTPEHVSIAQLAAMLTVPVFAGVID